MQAAWLVLNVVLVLLGCALFVPAAVLLVQTLAAVGRPATTGVQARGDRPRFALLVPAHNEASGIAATLVALRAQMEDGDRLVVVADNCTDETAALAAEQGAEVLVRHDPDRRGKGFALDHGVRHLAQDAPAIVIIVDADCLIAPGTLARLARTCAETGRPVQALYLMQSPADAGLKTRMGELAWIVKNLVRPLGFNRLGLPCQLMGTGMAFPWAALESAPLASGSIVEDMQLGVDLALAGTPPLFEPEARVTSVFPSTAEGLSSQRTRWEHGHIAMLLSQGPRLLWAGLVQRRAAVIAMALDLCVPPLSSLVIMTVLLFAAAVPLLVFAHHWSAFGLALVSMAMITLSVLLAWRRFGRQTVTLRELVSIPLYVAAKIPLYLRAARQRQTAWIRTRRDTD